MTDLIIRTEVLGGSPLARAAIDGQLDEWYAPRPGTPDEWRAAAGLVRANQPGRSWVEALAPALSATGAAATRLHRVADGNGVVVTTGQQPGLFGGPLYTWSKAISALTLADEIERVTGVPTVPVFWAATDDADYAEASWTAVGVPGGAERLALPAAVPLGRPMSGMPLGDPSAALDTLVRACGSTVDDRPLAAVSAAYHAGATVGGAYVALLRALFEPLGIAVLDASHASVSAAARAHLLLALERADVVSSALRGRDEAIRAAGFTPQVSEVAGLSLVFERDAGGGEKRRLPLKEARSYSGTGGVLSPNVLLRPVIERAILPTVSYVAGPGEIAYFAQVSAVAAALDLASPRVVPRWSVTIIEPHVARILGRFGLAAEDLADPHAAEGRLAREAVPAEVERAVSQLRQDVDRRVTAVGDGTVAANLGLAEMVIEGARRGVQHRIDRLERRIVAAVKRRELETMRQVATARGALYPLGIRQERALNAVPFLARHGSAFVDGMVSAARGHAVALVGTDSAPSTAATEASRSRAGDSRVGTRAEPTRVIDA
ncbi:MAG TPA: bacillithiol biosynthesis cysteine-adding enzyme BshC [Gemmatimonadaceae bacterium]|nr:bacillithiol biosynthesis cysteine-adding enzyme BshC [Gemmatimonadaceae bacterium]